jgi:zinc protease
MQNTIRKYWQTKNMFITIVTDKSEAEALAESLKNDFDSPMSYSDALKAVLDKELLMEDAMIAGYPLNVTSVKIVDSKETFK